MPEIVKLNKAQPVGEQAPTTETEAQPAKTSKTIASGRLELTIKISELPTPRTVENGWQQFEVDCEGTVFTITVKPKNWNKFATAAASCPMWVAAIGGKLGNRTPKGFLLLEPSIQIFEKKPKEPKPE
ncbi:MAG: hypothetical protein U7123_26240 [Potamolinea sp.]